MYVVKRDGRQEAVHFDKITARLKKLSYGLSIDHCDPVLVSQKVCAGVYKGVTTSQLDELAAETAAAMTANHPDYASVSSHSYPSLFQFWSSNFVLCYWFFRFYDSVSSHFHIFFYGVFMTFFRVLVSGLQIICCFRSIIFTLFPRNDFLHNYM